MLTLVAVGAGSAAPRKPHHATPAAATADTDTSATGAIPTPRPAVTAKDDDDETLPPPFHLPQAPRKRMRDCGMKWQAMKMSGEVGEAIWRDFATHCLAAANGPFDTRSER